MKRFFRQFHYGERGFTLIELLVVVAILGVLAAVAVPNIGKFMGEGKKEAGVTELHNVQTAMMALMADQEITTVTAVAPAIATANMSDFPDETYRLYGDVGFRYINKSATEFFYSCDGDGTVYGWWEDPLNLGFPSDQEIGVVDPP